MTRKPYTGILKEPMDRHGPEGMLQLVERLVALAEHYEVDPLGPNALSLVVELARDHVPGFQFKTKPSIRGLAGGRKPDVTKDIVILTTLFRADEAGESVAQAARDLADNHPDWGINEGAIRNRYQRMKFPKNSADRRRILRVVDTLALIDRHSKKTVGN